MRAKIFLALTILMTASLAQAWDVDFSRRQRRAPASFETPQQLPEKKSTVESQDITYAPSSGNYAVESEAKPDKPKKETRIDSLIQRAVNPSYFDRQEFVIMNTPKGFVPKNIRLRQGLHYTVHVVNVNEDKKNVSFILDGFAQHHSTYFGKIKTFFIDPKDLGVYDFICPESSAKGEIVVFGNSNPPPVDRKLSAEDQP